MHVIQATKLFSILWCWLVGWLLFFHSKYAINNGMFVLQSHFTLHTSHWSGKGSIPQSELSTFFMFVFDDTSFLYTYANKTRMILIIYFFEFFCRHAVKQDNHTW